MTCSVCPEHTYFFGTKTHCKEPTGLGINYLAHRAGASFCQGSPKVQTPPLPPPPRYKKNRHGSGVKIENLMPAQCPGLLIETNCIISITLHFAMDQIPSDIQFSVKRGSPARLEGRWI